MPKKHFESAPICAWLILWERDEKFPRVNRPFIDVVSSRKNITYMTDYVQRLHNLFCVSPIARTCSERYTNPSPNQYEAKFYRAPNGAIEIRCGQDPYIVARRVRNLIVGMTNSGDTTIVKYETSSAEHA